ncbi:storkhead-box protein 2 isoform X1 [Megalobrama amblycephala]|uniref:storkhead-box protein 2 isoform X1 n=2 Tax=Megalobrama amblycephala TaxID=75352 RepID=UPI0020141C0A|nr:storkhead-box protein 2 isoform X1 [Megalobrama amblycephala]XP_048032006.1 storkhead-box protein 2 isoform X1 [Megalobrama amblycephala]
MEPFLQIAPHSLAIVLSRVVAEDAPGVTESEEPPHHHTGYEIFADFKSLNMKYFWNKMVADAIAETFFLGWIDEHVLLIQGKEDHLEVLREAWMRRSLKPPQGFDIKYLGDVSPISMSPISQSQFIPLGEILCLAISAMNSARKTVTQETLIEHLATCFPGVPTPSMEILRHTLNMLVRERKIYPTPEGYFIVTQQTYFITPSLIRTNSKWYHLDERIPERMQQQQQQQQPCTSPHSGTMTPSTSGCVRERTHHKNHSDSYNNSYREDMPSTHTSTLQRRSKEHKEVSPVSPPPQQPSEKSKSALSFPFKTETNSKHKDGSSSSGEKQSKKFGLKLFRLSFKKDKTKHLATFSAQFPPEEWPLRDEETPTTVPREVEMEIIRRINPDLTVENLARHTAVMKRLEEEKAQRNKANSSAQQSARSKRSRSHRKTQQGKASRSHSKTRASRGDPSEGSNLDISYDRDYRFYSSSLVRSPRETMMSMERNRGKYMVHSNPNIVESHFTTAPEWDVSGELAKRRTEMPFPEPSRAQSHSKVHRSHSHTQERKSRNERSDKAKERSRSMDNSKGPLGGPFLGGPEEFECSPDDRNRYYTDDGTLRASAQATHYSRIMLSAARLHSDVCVPDVGRGSSEDAVLYRTLEKSKSRDSLPAYNDLKSCSPKTPVDDYFQCTAANEVSLSAPSSLVKPSHDFTDSVWKGISSDRLTPHLPPPHPIEYKEETAKGQSSIPIATTSQTPEHLPNGRLLHQHNPDSGDLDKMPEVYSQETLFKPPDYVESSFSRPGTIGKSPHTKSAEVLETQEHFDKPLPLTVPPSSAQEQASCAETTFDYYNVSDDDSEETSHKNRVEEKVLEEGGTMQWLLEREKERDLQRKFEKNLTFLSPKEGEGNNSQKSVHSTRLDSMDSSSVTVDSGFNSPRTRESLASNTSSNVENSRRQNMALSPGHIGTKRPPPPYQPPSFRTIREPPANRTEKQASITSV